MTRLLCMRLGTGQPGATLVTCILRDGSPRTQADMWSSLGFCRRAGSSRPWEEVQMKASRYPAFLVVTAMLAWPALAQQAARSTNVETDFAAIEAAQNAANAQAGPRTVPERSIPVPDTVSLQLQSAIAAPYRVPAWDANPKSAAEWKELVN